MARQFGLVAEYPPKHRSGVSFSNLLGLSQIGKSICHTGQVTYMVIYKYLDTFFTLGNISQNFFKLNFTPFWRKSSARVVLVDGGVVEVAKDIM